MSLQKILVNRGPEGGKFETLPRSKCCVDRGRGGRGGAFSSVPVYGVCKMFSVALDGWTHTHVSFLLFFNAGKKTAKT